MTKPQRTLLEFLKDGPARIITQWTGQHGYVWIAKRRDQCVQTHIRTALNCHANGWVTELVGTWALTDVGRETLRKAVGK